MELLDGEDLLTYLWRRRADDSDGELGLAATTGNDPTPSTGGNGEVTRRGADPGLGRPSPCDFGRLRAVLPQLARGLHALHAAGKIHRDVKPSNIRVTTRRPGGAARLRAGRRARAPARRRASGEIVGTVAYMAPEQCAGDVPLDAGGRLVRARRRDASRR